jgi:hypothetical protein
MSFCIIVPGLCLFVLVLDMKIGHVESINGALQTKQRSKYEGGQLYQLVYYSSAL